MTDETVSVKGRGRGFAAMTPERRKAIAAKGGRSVDPANRSFSKDRSLAARAGSKGGKSVDPKKRSFAQSRDLASSAGKKGGRGRAKKEAPPV